jgi:hypothetical protein
MVKAGTGTQHIAAGVANIRFFIITVVVLGLLINRGATIMRVPPLV